jgi:site-specific DNA recombinase
MPTTQTAAHKTGRLVFGYCRVSTDKQADKGVSLDAQTAKIQAMAVVQGAELSEVITDAGESAKSLERPGLQRLLALVDAGQVQAVIIAKLDRLTRSVKDLALLLERFQRRGVSLVSVAESLDTGSAAGRLVLNIMVSVSQWEREAIGERTATALQFKKSARRVYSPVPYGYERQLDALVPLAEEQAVVGRIRLLSSNGYSLRRIAAALNADAIPTKQGRQWAAQTVADVLSNSLHRAEAVVA